jgi:hypothetical protein
MMRLLALSAVSQAVAQHIWSSHFRGRPTCTVYPGKSNATDDVPTILTAFERCGRGGDIIFPANETYHINSRLNPVVDDVHIDWHGEWEVSIAVLVPSQGVILTQSKVLARPRALAKQVLPHRLSKPRSWVHPYWRPHPHQRPFHRRNQRQRASMVFRRAKRNRRRSRRCHASRTSDAFRSVERQRRRRAQLPHYPAAALGHQHDECHQYCLRQHLRQRHISRSPSRDKLGPKHRWLQCVFLIANSFPITHSHTQTPWTPLTCT